MLHQTFLLLIVKVSFLKHDVVVQRRINGLHNYFNDFVVVSLRESRKSVSVAKKTLQNLKFVENNLYYLIYNIL